MPTLPIVRYPDPVLRQVCLPVHHIDEDLRQLAADMLDTMYAAPGRGLAAPQIGIALRLFVMDPTWKDGIPAPRVCLNPEILAVSDDDATRDEGCLSIPGIPVRVTRPAEVTLRWTDLAGVVMEERLTGFAATVAQHELDHLNGRVILDLMDEPGRRAVSLRLAAGIPLPASPA
jgi:peptide deformylase